MKPKHKNKLPSNHYNGLIIRITTLVSLIGFFLHMKDSLVERNSLVSGTSILTGRPTLTTCLYNILTKNGFLTKTRIKF